MFLCHDISTVTPSYLKRTKTANQQLCTLDALLGLFCNVTLPLTLYLYKGTYSATVTHPLTMTHILHPGNYIIANKAHNLHLGRGIHEEDSLLPKDIVTLPGGVRAPIWKVERLHNGRYKLAVSKPPGREHFVADIKNKVYAILDPKDPVKPTEWTIKPIEGFGPHVYIVEAPSRKVWAVPQMKPYTQVIVETIIVLAEAQEEIPLPYSPTQLFTFSPAPRDNDEVNDEVKDD